MVSGDFTGWIQLIYLQYVQVFCITFSQMIFHDVCCCLTGPVLCSVFILMEHLFFLPITVMTHCLALFIFLFFLQPRRDNMFPAGKRKEKKNSLGQTVSSWLSECVQFSCIWGLSAGCLCLCECWRLVNSHLGFDLCVASF